MLNHPRDAIRGRVAEMMRLLQLDEMGERKPSQLSGGQQQRVALGRALAPAPKVLLLDEPLSALDHKLRKEMQVELKRLQAATGITFVFVTHDQEEALTMSNRIAVMNKGEVMQVGSPSAVYDRPTSRFVAEFIGDTNFLEAICIGREGASGRFRVDVQPGKGLVLSADDAAGAREGEAVLLAIRPERIAIDNGQTAQLHATVRDTIYSGSDVMLHTVLANGRPMRVRLPSDSPSYRSTTGITGFFVPASAVRVFSA
jgi:spermidine/putrescine transport system ATP-binding protein